MAITDPSSIDVKALFRDTSMFKSRRAWSAAGFDVIARDNNGKIMVARHPSVPGYLFKKYTSDVSSFDQFKNYTRRVEGSKRLRAFTADRKLSCVVVPRKWLLELPRAFWRHDDPSHVIVVQHLDLRSDEQTKASYERIDPTALVELCTVLFHFRGMDSSIKNIPFLRDGRIAFIDTEHWDRRSDKAYLHQVGEYLSSSQRRIAKRIFGQLKSSGSIPDLGSLNGDFDDEEDTSSSSSSSSFSSS